MSLTCCTRHAAGIPLVGDDARIRCGDLTAEDIDTLRAAAEDAAAEFLPYGPPLAAALLATLEQLARVTGRATEMHRRAQRLEGVEARIARVRAGYERLVAYLYREGARQRSGARRRMRAVYDALAAAGFPWGTPHPTRRNTWDGKPSYADAPELIGMLAAERDALRAELAALRPAPRAPVDDRAEVADGRAPLVVADGWLDID